MNALITIDILLLIIALICVVLSLVKAVTPYLNIAVLLVVIDLLIHVIPK